jgi:hypothetical protein
MAADWLAAPELHALVDAYRGYEDKPRGDTRIIVAWSTRFLDTRGKAERRDAPPICVPDRAKGPLLSAGRALGLLSTPPPSAHRYQAIVVLGGATTGNVLRTELAADVSRRVSWSELVGLSSDRELGATEHLSDPDSVDDGVEWVHVLRQIRLRFGPLISSTTTGGDDTEHIFTDESGHVLRIMVAPRDESDRRPSTARQLDFLCRRRPADERESVLLITNSIYAPYQFFAGAAVLLDEGCRRVELIGTPTDIDEDSEHGYQRLAQEIHSAILTAAALRH